jgi:hypothetical protein
MPPADKFQPALERFPVVPVAVALDGGQGCPRERAFDELSPGRRPSGKASSARSASSSSCRREYPPTHDRLYPCPAYRIREAGRAPRTGPLGSSVLWRA